VPDSALLTRASITFQTNDEDKDDDTLLDVTVALIDGTVVAQVSDVFSTFHDNHEDGPYDLELVDPRTRGDMKRRQRQSQDQPERQRHVAVRLLPRPALRR
jgi:hypothetical protein